MKKLLIGKQSSFNNGNPIGKLPFGYIRNSNNEIVFDKCKIEIVYEIFKLRFKGLGYGTIAKNVNLYNNDDKPKISLIRVILTNIFYTGYIKFGKNIVKGNHKGIIDINDFLFINKSNSIKEFL